MANAPWVGLFCHVKFVNMALSQQLFDHCFVMYSQPDNGVIPGGYASAGVTLHNSCSGIWSFKFKLAPLLGGF